MSRKPVSQTGKPGASPGRVAIPPASIEVMQQTFNLLSTEHSRGGGPLLLEAQPDQRAGTASKTDRAIVWHGEHALGLPPVSISHSFRFGRAVMHLSRKQDQAGAAPAAGSISPNQSGTQSMETMM